MFRSVASLSPALAFLVFGLSLTEFGGARSYVASPQQQAESPTEAPWRSLPFVVSESEEGWGVSSLDGHKATKVTSVDQLYGEPAEGGFHFCVEVLPSAASLDVSVRYADAGGQKLLTFRLRGGVEQPVLEGRAWVSSHLGPPRPPVPRPDLHGVVEFQRRSSSEGPLRMRWVLLGDLSTQFWGAIEIPSFDGASCRPATALEVLRLPPSRPDGEGQRVERVTIHGGSHWEGVVDSFGRRQGQWAQLDESGSKLAELSYRDGLAHGPCQEWWSSGSRKLKGSFEQGLKAGEWQYWDPSGHVTASEFVKGLKAPLAPSKRGE